MLIVVSGPDRVGKSTMIKQMTSKLQDRYKVFHHSGPTGKEKDAFQQYRKDIKEFVDDPQCDVAIFDRGWPCTYILEQHRKRNAGHFEDMIDFEHWVHDMLYGKVVHVGRLRPWHWSAPHHLEELRTEMNESKSWYIRDEYIARMEEHKVYTQQLLDFYEDITMFPNIQLTSDIEGESVLSLCNQALKSNRWN